MPGCGRWCEAPHALQVFLTEMAGDKESLECGCWWGLHRVCVCVQVCRDTRKVSICKSPHLTPALGQRHLAVPKQQLTGGLV